MAGIYNNLKILLTSDWQTNFDNLAESAIALEELLVQATEHKVDAIVHAGDCKHVYNPVSILVINFWVSAVTQIVNSGFRFIVLLGNHDRVSQSHDAKNWFPVLRAAGAEIVTQPKVKEVGDCKIAFLPYTSDKVKEKKWATKLLQDKSDVLIFHTEIAGIEFATGVSSQGNSPAELGFSSYSACFGGHIHKYQKISLNSWYIGSPFTMDWGEANQRKGNLLVTCDGTSTTHKRLYTKLPAWYDYEYLDTHNITPEEGAYVRSKVIVTSKKIADKIRAKEAEILAKYGPGIKPFVVPKIEQAETDSVLLDGASDDDVCQQYVLAKFPENARFNPQSAVAYLSGKLKGTDYKATMHAVTFRNVTASNVLVFDTVTVDYENKGLVLLKGINHDWPKSSNGSGKTSVLSLLPLALEGKTLKEQTADAWASERNDKPAMLALELTDERNRKIIVSRSRRPKTIRLEINGIDQSSGMRGIGKTETQGLIRETVGYDWQTLLNSVYIDQTIANGFVFGSNALRMQLVSKFQNLERFDAALKAVAVDDKATGRVADKVTAQLEDTVSDIAECQRDLESANKTIEKTWDDEVKRLTVALAAAESSRDTLLANKPKIDKCIARRKQVAKLADENADAIDNLRSRIHHHTKEMQRVKKLVEASACPTCEQSIPAKFKLGLENSQKKLSGLSKQIGECDVARLSFINELEYLDKYVNAHLLDLAAANTKVNKHESLLAQAKVGLAKEIEWNATIAKDKAKITTKLNVLRADQTQLQAREKALAVEMEMLDFAKKAFSRKGIPMYLSSSLCPVLNKAADRYAELFFDGSIKLRFNVDDGEFKVSAVNAAGSETIEGQSVGEAARCGIICAFALRDIAPKTNLLILDEPGNGLDSEGAKQFARGLLKLKKQFDTIILTTHNPVIEAELSGETTWVVEKKNGVAKLTCQN